MNDPNLIKKKQWSKQTKGGLLKDSKNIKKDIEQYQGAIVGLKNALDKANFQNQINIKVYPLQEFEYQDQFCNLNPHQISTQINSGEPTFYNGRDSRLRETINHSKVNTTQLKDSVHIQVQSSPSNNK